MLRGLALQLLQRLAHSFVPPVSSTERARKMSSPGINGDPKPPCLPRNGLVKLPGQPNGLGAASITKGTPAAKNRPCQPPPPPTLPPPSLATPLSRVALAGGPCPPASGPASGPVPGPPVERPPLATDEKILNGLFWYFSACEKCILAQVCKAWRRVLYQPKFWAGLTPVLHAKELYNVLPGGEKEFVNLQGFAARGFEGFCLVGVSDLDICEFIDNYALSKKGVKAMSLKRSTITDAGLEVCPQIGCEWTGPEGQAQAAAVLQTWEVEGPRACSVYTGQKVTRMVLSGPKCKTKIWACC